MKKIRYYEVINVIFVDNWINTVINTTTQVKGLAERRTISIMLILSTLSQGAYYQSYEQKNTVPSQLASCLLRTQPGTERRTSTTELLHEDNEIHYTRVSSRISIGRSTSTLKWCSLAGSDWGTSAQGVPHQRLSVAAERSSARMARSSSVLVGKAS